MPDNVAHKLMQAHGVAGSLRPGAELALRVDQTLTQDATGTTVMLGNNYGQGSSREHAVLAPRYLGLRAVLARSFARIHFQNLVSYGVLPLLVRPEDHARLGLGARLVIDDVHRQLAPGQPVRIVDEATQTAFEVTHDMSARQLEVVRAGGIITEVAQRLGRDLGLPPAEVA